MKALSLAEAEATALRHQPTLEQALGQVEAAEGRRRTGARRLPAAGQRSSGNYQRTTGELRAPSGRSPARRQHAAPTGGWSAQTYNYFNFGATATQLIYDFGLTSERWRSAAASRDAASWNRRAIENQTLLGGAARVLPGAGAARSGRRRRGERRATRRSTSSRARRWSRPASGRTSTSRRCGRRSPTRACSWSNAQNNYAVAQAQLAQAMGVELDRRATRWRTTTCRRSPARTARPRR